MDLGFHIKNKEIEKLLQSHTQELSNEDLLEMEAEKEKEKEEAAVGTTIGISGRVINSKVLRKAVAKIKDELHLLEKMTQMLMGVLLFLEMCWITSSIMQRR